MGKRYIFGGIPDIRDLMHEILIERSDMLNIKNHDFF